MILMKHPGRRPLTLMMTRQNRTAAAAVAATAAGTSRFIRNPVFDATYFHGGWRSEKCETSTLFFIYGDTK